MGEGFWNTKGGSESPFTSARLARSPRSMESPTLACIRSIERSAYRPSARAFAPRFLLVGTTAYLVGSRALDADAANVTPAA
jgi:hypothetical protein